MWTERRGRGRGRGREGSIVVRRIENPRRDAGSGYGGEFSSRGGTYRHSLLPDDRYRKHRRATRPGNWFDGPETTFLRCTRPGNLGGTPLETARNLSFRGRNVSRGTGSRPLPPKEGKLCPLSRFSEGRSENVLSLSLVERTGKCDAVFESLSDLTAPLEDARGPGKKARAAPLPEGSQRLGNDGEKWLVIAPESAH